MNLPRRLWRAARHQVMDRLGLDFRKAARSPQSAAYDEIDSFLTEPPGPRPPHEAQRRTSPPPPPPPRTSSGPREGTESRKQPEPPPRHPLEAEYRTLGVPVGADLAAVRTRWRSLVRETHPDRFAHDPAAQQAASDRLRLVNAAYFRIRDHLK